MLRTVAAGYLLVATSCYGEEGDRVNLGDELVTKMSQLGNGLTQHLDQVDPPIESYGWIKPTKITWQQSLDQSTL